MGNIITRDGAPGTQTQNLSGKGSDLTYAELDSNFYALAITTDGTVEANRAIIVDANKDFTGVRHITSTGTITGASLTVGSEAITGKAPTVQVFTTVAANQTWTKPAGCKKILVEVQGGGGGGAGANAGANDAQGGNGGSGGGYARKLIDVTGISSGNYVTVGDGGAGGIGVDGADGDASTWIDGVNTITASGGLGGSKGSSVTGFNAQNGKVGGTATGVGTDGVAIRGGGSGGSLVAGSTIASGDYFVLSLHGGSSYFGTGGEDNALNASGSTSDGFAGKGYGAGGSGGASTNGGGIATGGAGSQGIVIVTEFY